MPPKSAAKIGNGDYAPLSLIQAAWVSLRLFITGIKDGVSVWKAIPLLFSCPGALKMFVLILIANTAFWSSMYALNQLVIGPVFNIAAVDGWVSVLQSNKLPTLLIQIGWLVPLLRLGQTQAPIWSEELADHIYRYKKHLHEEVLPKHTTDSTYAVLVWLFALIQVTIWPMLGQRVEETANSYGFNQLGRVISSALWMLGFLIQCCIYAQYSFETAWQSWGVGPEEKYKCLERRWEYFVGFGLPYAFNARYATFFSGYAIYLAISPLVLMTACVSDPNATYISSDLSYTSSVPEYNDEKKQRNLNLLLSAKAHAPHDSIVNKSEPRLLKSFPFYYLANIITVTVLRLFQTREAASDVKPSNDGIREESISPQGKGSRGRSRSRSKKGKSD